jgi:hypothetical protein
MASQRDIEFGVDNERCVMPAEAIRPYVFAARAKGFSSPAEASARIELLLRRGSSPVFPFKSAFFRFDIYMLSHHCLIKFNFRRPS